MNSEKIKKSLKFLDSWLDFKYRREEIPGFVVAISHNDKLIFNQAYGFANLETKEYLKSDHIFRIASHSKTFTATAIMQLAEQEKLTINDKIVDYLPWLNEHKDKRFKSVTINQLLSHGAGIISNGRDSDYWELKKKFLNKEQFKKEILETNLALDNGIRMKYSNFGYTLLGLIIEQISGKSYNDFMIENIITPLGLNSTGTDINKEILSKIVTGYSRPDKKRLPIAKEVGTYAMAPAAGFYSTTEDLCKYFNAHKIGSNQLLSDKSKQEMRRVRWKFKNNVDKNKYGLGFVITPIGKRDVFGHFGGLPGQITISMCDPKDELIVVVLTNCYDGPAQDIAKGTISVLEYFNKHYSIQKQDKFDKFEGRVMSLWGIIDIVSMGKKLVAISPETWTPFNNPEGLIAVNDTTLKALKTDGFNYNEGELVHFKFDKNNNIESVNYTGSTMLPERIYLSIQDNLKSISFPSRGVTRTT